MRLRAGETVKRLLDPYGPIDGPGVHGTHWLCDNGPEEPQPDGRPFDIAQADSANRRDEHLDRRDLLPVLDMVGSTNPNFLAAPRIFGFEFVPGMPDGLVGEVFVVDFELASERHLRATVEFRLMGRLDLNINVGRFSKLSQKDRQ